MSNAGMSAMSTPEPEPQVQRPTKKVAVVAVHGISDQKPYDSARAIADLLANCTDYHQSAYAPFRERFIRLKVTPLKPQAQVNIKVLRSWNARVYQALNWGLPKSWADRFFKLWQSVDERGPYMKRMLMGRPEDPTDPLTQPDYLFIRDQIEDYTQESIYESIRLESQCTFDDSDSHQPTQVHVYEMYWADLSRLGTGFVRIFGELYQLLFHLGSLGRQSVDLARAENQTAVDRGSWGELSSLWAWYSATQVLASRLLALFLPILNLCLLVAALMSLPGLIPLAYAPWVAVLSTGLLLALVVAYRVLSKNLTGFWQWLLLPFLAGLIGALGVEVFITGQIQFGIPLGTYRWLALEWATFLSAVIWFILIKPYSRHRPGADVFAIAVSFPLALVALWFLQSAPNSHEGLTFASLRMVEIIYMILLWGWFAFLLMYFAALGIGGLAIARIPRSTVGATHVLEQQQRRARAKQAAWTARFSLAVPAILFSFLTLSLWTALARLGSSLLPDSKFYQPLWFFADLQASYKPADFARQLTIFSGSPLAAIVIGLLAVAIGILLWAFGPAILSERFALGRNDLHNRFAQGLGNWLNYGFQLILGPGDWIISWCIPFLFLAGTIDGISLLAGGGSILAKQFPGLATAFNSTDTLLNWVAAFITASATSLIALGGRLNQISLGLRGFLDAALDVDNYLRLHPRDDNPTARIYARYASLLRYLYCPGNDETPYDAVIVVAHSQGTVITADLLRFLNLDPDPVLEDTLGKATNLYLFTMGSPLRQLYSFAFPHLYYWMSNDDKVTPKGWMLEAQAQPLPQNLLGVKAWINAFRSGDYVGRYLWRSSRMQELWYKVNLQSPPPDLSEQEIEAWRLKFPSYLSEDDTKGRREFCLGVGAHTHYWDRTAPEVACEIDRLVREC
ncbi:MAG TPA: hypothetical protein V6D19_07250 [Stenomitos sp.]